MDSSLSVGADREVTRMALKRVLVLRTQNSFLADGVAAVGLGRIMNEA